MGDRKNIRLRNFDYCTPGFYFVTICTQGSRCLFGEVSEGVLIESDFAGTARRCWERIPEFYPHTALVEFVVMPNHVHLLLQLLADINSKPSPASLAKVVTAYKAAVTSQVRILKEDRKFQVWQRGYFEHVVRNEDGLHKIRDYIRNNPLAWSLDRENLKRTGMDEFDVWLDSL